MLITSIVQNILEEAAKKGEIYGLLAELCFILNEKQI